MKIYERNVWGAVPVSGYARTNWKKGLTLWVHYSDSPYPPATLAAECAVMRGIQNFHRGPERGWLDIGYHFVIGPSGRVYRGRPAETVGAHAPGANHEPGVCLMLGVGQHPTPAQLRSLGELGNFLGAARMRPHSDAIATACPGNIVRSWVRSWRPGGPDSTLPAWIDTLQIVLNPPPVDDLSNRRRWVGKAAWGSLVWVARYGATRLNPGTAVAIAYRPHPDKPYRVERDRKTVLAICRSLHATYPKGSS